MDIILLFAAAIASFAYLNYKIDQLKDRLEQTHTQVRKVDEKLDHLIAILTDSKVIPPKPNGPVHERDSKLD